MDILWEMLLNIMGKQLQIFFIISHNSARKNQLRRLLMICSRTICCDNNIKKQKIIVQNALCQNKNKKQNI